MMADPVVFVDYEPVDYRKACVSVFDYTLHCGLGYFESILAVGERLMYLDDHLDRLEGGIDRVGLTVNYNRRKASKALREAARLQGSKTKKMKLILTTGYYPLWPGSKPRPRSLVIAVDHRLVFRRQRLMMSNMVVNTADRLRGLKTTNYMLEWVSNQEAMRQGFDQGIILNQRGNIAETGSSNIFLVKNGRVITPSITEGGLPGVTRRRIIEVCRRDGLSITERAVKPNDLIEAEEIFTTSSFKLVWPVVALRAGKTYRYSPGPVARAIFVYLKQVAEIGNESVELAL
jgi:branched-chain amino acid aminotransferase